MHAKVDTVRPSITDEPVESAAADEAVADVVPATAAATAAAAAAVRPAAPATPAAARAQRRSVRPPPEPVDYSKDYAAARRDLTLIALWAGLLIVGMIALKLSGLV